MQHSAVIVKSSCLAAADRKKDRKNNGTTLLPDESEMAEGIFLTGDGAKQYNIGKQMSLG